VQGKLLQHLCVEGKLIQHLCMEGKLIQHLCVEGKLIQHLCVVKVKTPSGWDFTPTAKYHPELTSMHSNTGRAGLTCMLQSSDMT